MNTDDFIFPESNDISYPEIPSIASTPKISETSMSNIHSNVMQTRSPSRSQSSTIFGFVSRNIVLIGIVLLILAGLLYYYLNVWKKQSNVSVNPSVQKASTSTTVPMKIVPIKDWSQIQNGGFFILSTKNAQGNLEPSVGLTLIRQPSTSKGSLQFSGDKLNNITWVDSSATNENIFLQYDNGHTSVIKKDIDGSIQFVDLDVILNTDGSQKGVKETVFYVCELVK
jgi:hypothetical protein